MKPTAIDNMWAKWKERITPVDPDMRIALAQDTWHHHSMELMRRMAHFYDQAMELEDVPELTRQRVLSMVLLGSPDGLDVMERRHLVQELESVILSTPPKPIYFNPYPSIPGFHPDLPPKEWYG